MGKPPRIRSSKKTKRAVKTRARRKKHPRRRESRKQKPWASLCEGFRLSLERQLIAALSRSPSLSVRTNTNQRSSYFQLSWIHFHSVPCQRPLKIALFFGSTQDIAIYIITRGNSQSSSSTVCACVKCVSCTWRLISCCIATVIIARNRTEYFCGLPLVAFGPHHPYTRRSQHPCPW